MRVGVYHYKEYDFSGGYVPHSTNVEIVDESEKSYKVKFLQCGPRKQVPGTITWVSKKFVKTINS